MQPGEMQNKIKKSIAPLIDAVDDICRYFFQTGKIGDQSSLGDEREHECLGDLVRGDLCTGVALLLQDGRAASWPFAHIWELCDGSRLKQVRINTFGEYSLAEAVKAIAGSSIGSSKDMCFRALIVLGLNMGLLHTWLAVLSSRRQVNEKVYDHDALMRTPEAMETVFSQLCRLLTFPFQLLVESEASDTPPEEDEPSTDPKDLGFKCGNFLQAAVSASPVKFKVKKEAGVFTSAEETLIVGGASGLSPWSLVFGSDDDQRVLDLGRVIDVTVGDPTAEDPSFTITFGPRTRTETFFCDDMQACVSALHALLWNFSLMRTPHLIQHREALDARSLDSMRFFVQMSRAWYANATAKTPSPEPALPPPSPVRFSVPDRVCVDDKTGQVCDVAPDDESVLLTHERLAALQEELPRRLQTRRVLLSYTTDEHGFSLTHFLQRTRDIGQTLVLIQDSRGDVFGVFASESWRLERAYYGTGEAFLFKLTPEVQLFPWVPDSNNFIMQAEESGIGVGAGAGGCGLWLDNSFKHGRTQKCATFENEPLSSKEEFLCVKLECWSFTKPKGVRVSSY